MLRKTVLHYLRRLLALEDTPERIALAFALGVFLAFSPLLGFHTILGLLVAFLFGLNRVAMLVGIFVNNPWTLVPIYALANYVGGLLVGIPTGRALPRFGWSAIFEGNFWVQMAHSWRVLLPLLVGSLTLSTLAATVSYPVVLYVIRHGRSRRLQSS